MAVRDPTTMKINEFHEQDLFVSFVIIRGIRFYGRDDLEIGRWTKDGGYEFLIGKSINDVYEKRGHEDWEVGARFLIKIPGNRIRRGAEGALRRVRRALIRVARLLKTSWRGVFLIKHLEGIGVRIWAEP